MSFWRTLRKFTLRCPLSASCLYFTNYTFIWGFPGSSDSAYSEGGAGSIPGSGRSPGKGNGYPLQYSCLEKSHGPRSLVGYSSWGHKESDMTERLHFTSLHFTSHFYLEFITFFILQIVSSFKCMSLYIFTVIKFTEHKLTTLTILMYTSHCEATTTVYFQNIFFTSKKKPIF